MSDLSKFRIYSVGRVAADKKRGSVVIEVTPVEKLPHINDEVTDHVETLNYKAQGTDSTDAQDVDVETSVSEQATWLPIGNTNRATAPDVMRGEYVLLYKFADAPTLYWVDLKTMRNLRRLETVTWFFSNVRERDEEATEDNSYTLSVSTHDKHITICTNKNDGEPFAYTIQLNTKTGFFTLTDDVGNYILLDSENTRIRLENKDKTFIDLNRKSIFGEAVENIAWKCKNFSVDAASVVNIKTINFTNKSTNYKLNSNSMEYTGTAVLNGNWRVNGNSHVSGNSFEGSSSGPNNRE